MADLTPSASTAASTGPSLSTSTTPSPATPPCASRSTSRRQAAEGPRACPVLPRGPQPRRRPNFIEKGGRAASTRPEHGLMLVAPDTSPAAWTSRARTRLRFRLRRPASTSTPPAEPWAKHYRTVQLRHQRVPALVGGNFPAPLCTPRPSSALDGRARSADHRAKEPRPLRERFGASPRSRPDAGPLGPEGVLGLPRPRRGGVARARRQRARQQTTLPGRDVPSWWTRAPPTVPGEDSSGPNFEKACEEPNNPVFRRREGYDHGYYSSPLSWRTTSLPRRGAARLTNRKLRRTNVGALRPRRPSRGVLSAARMPRRQPFARPLHVFRVMYSQFKRCGSTT
jgi:hypothetical protein